MVSGSYNEPAWLSFQNDCRQDDWINRRQSRFTYLVIQIWNCIRWWQSKRPRKNFDLKWLFIRWKRCLNFWNYWRIFKLLCFFRTNFLPKIEAYGTGQNSRKSKGFQHQTYEITLVRACQRRWKQDRGDGKRLSGWLRGNKFVNRTISAVQRPFLRLYM